LVAVPFRHRRRLAAESWGRELRTLPCFFTHKSLSAETEVLDKRKRHVRKGEKALGYREKSTGLPDSGGRPQ